MLKCDNGTHAVKNEKIPYIQVYKNKFVDKQFFKKQID